MARDDLAESSVRSEKKRLLDEQEREQRFFQKAKTIGVGSLYLTLFVLIVIFTIVSNRRKEKTVQENNFPPVFSELYRPQVHFSPLVNFMNDPNGLVYVKPYYHMFYQYNPGGIQWGNMSWGHARSKDLVHWEHLPVAIPIEDGVAIFSGSAVVDVNNTSGFKAEGSASPPPVVAIYTGYVEKSEIQEMDIAYSQDGAGTFTKYKNNPVININSTAFRDPKVTWYKPGQYWVVALVLADEHKVVFYKSTNLKQWSRLSTFGPAGPATGVWECPDLFPLQADDGKEYWVLVVNTLPLADLPATMYFVGHFDGTSFTVLSSKKHRTGEEGKKKFEVREYTEPMTDHTGRHSRASVESSFTLQATTTSYKMAGNDSGYPFFVDHGFDFYAAVGYNHLPDEPKENVFVGWMDNWAYANNLTTYPWRGQMTVPREVTLHKERDGTFRLRHKYAKALEGLSISRSRLPHKDGVTLQAPTVNAIDKVSTITFGSLLRIKAEFTLGDGASFGLGVFLRNDTSSAGATVSQETLISYDSKDDSVSVDRTNSGRVPDGPGFAGKLVSSAPAYTDPKNNTLSLDIVLDWNSVEVLVNGGRSSLSNLIFPDPLHNLLMLYVDGGSVTVTKFDVHELTTVWNPTAEDDVQPND